MIIQRCAKTGGNRFGDLNSSKMHAALAQCVAGPVEKVRRNVPARGLSIALTCRLRTMRSARQLQQAPSPGLNTGPTSGKMPVGWTMKPPRAVSQMFAV